GVLATILVAFVLQRVWKIDYRQEARKLRGGIYPVEQEIYNRTVEITKARIQIGLQNVGGSKLIQVTAAFAAHCANGNLGGTHGLAFALNQ
ncbi:MAG: hypothetical protein HGB14_05930, partial [Anaerolineaceae bacterium]|nr:hypothetical protein [Anaerolineaceae bacterium]